jgi:hypothetical protein
MSPRYEIFEEEVYFIEQEKCQYTIFIKNIPASLIWLLTQSHPDSNATIVNIRTAVILFLTAVIICRTAVINL